MLSRNILYISLFLAGFFTSCNNVSYIYYSDLPSTKVRNKKVHSEIVILKNRGKVKRITRISKSNRRTSSKVVLANLCDTTNTSNSDCFQYLEGGKVVKWNGAFYLRNDLSIADYRNYINRDIDF